MKNVYLNELSLEGQFTKEEFLKASIPFIRCLKFVNENGGQVQKHSAFYKQKITEDMTWNDLRGMRGDEIRRLKSLLLATTDNPPFWDQREELKQDLASTYELDGYDVAVTSVAEAAEDEAMLLSFDHPRYADCRLDISKNHQEVLTVPSAISLPYMAGQCWEMEQIDLYQYLVGRYEGTRLDFSQLEPEYGFGDFQTTEIIDCLQSFERFVSLESWDRIFEDKRLHYKKYSPSSEKDNWFRGDKYSNLSIDKFRCVNPKRCFGYREYDVFHVLRMERDHSISDKG